ncbi:transcriptional regulator [Aeromonas veronii]
MADTEAIEISKGEIFLINDSIVFNQISSELSCNNKFMKLAHTEANILLMLILNKNNIVTRERLIEFSWGDRVVTDSSLAKSISNLRKALRSLGQNDECIITVPRLGYRFTLQAYAIEYTNNSTAYNNETESPPNEKMNTHNKSSTINSYLEWPNNKIQICTWEIIKKLINFVSICMLIISGYNLLWKVDNDLRKKHVANNYEEKVINVNGSNYTVIKEKELTITNEISSIISFASPGSVVFIKFENDIYNVSVSNKNKTSSFSFKTKNIQRAKCQIKGILTRDNKVCEH